jgi:hypothetical protein
MFLPFDETKTTQAAALFLKLAGGSMNYMKLIRLLYLLDRAALLRWNRPATWDSYYSTKHGPVLSETYDLLTDTPPEEPHYWTKYISEPSELVVKLLKDPGDGRLSEAETEIIREVSGEYCHFKSFDLDNHLKKVLPEVKNAAPGTRALITYAEILEAVGKSCDEIESITEELESLSAIQRFSVEIPLVSQAGG